MNPGDSLPKNIILIGFMGCGKSTIGRKLEGLLGYPMVDTDHLIEEKTGERVADIFASRGENYFRELEAAVLMELAAPDAPRRIISTGGGIITRKRNRSLLKQLGYVVWLQAPVAVILSRTTRNRDRPLLDVEDPRGKIESLLSERTPMYSAAADLEVETDDLDAGEIACGILESARYHFAKP
ncbi:MAG: shikimate kinase [Verrucomicrobiota bacterium]